MIRKLYAANYEERREEAFLRSGGRCENIVNGDRCTVKLGDLRLTRTKHLQFEDLICHHPNGDPENPEAELLIVCWACHMRLHRRPGPGRPKASAKKQGYTVVRIPYLLDQLARSGFSTWQADGGIGWRIGDLAYTAPDAIEAIAMALHWQASEIRDLRAKLHQAHTSVHPTGKESIYG